MYIKKNVVKRTSNDFSSDTDVRSKLYKFFVTFIAVGTTFIKLRAFLDAIWSSTVL